MPRRIKYAYNLMLRIPYLIVKGIVEYNFGILNWSVNKHLVTSGTVNVNTD